MSTQVTEETNHISLLHDSTMSNALNFCCFFYVFYCNLKKDHIKRNIHSKRRKCLKQQKIKLPLSYF